MTEPAAILRATPEGRLADRTMLDDPALARVLGMLDVDGEQARVVGGAVRNALLGQPPGDIDIATTALPDVVMKRARKAGLRPIPTGLAHGTVTVMASGTPFEVTTLREDVETDGRHAVVRFGRDFATDAQRRDFTINALSISPDGTIHDSTGGVADLASGRVRFIGEADRRIREDFLRILRFFRFSAAYGSGQLDPEGLAASARHRDGIGRLSRERIRAELLKLLVACHAAPVVRAMDEAGIAAIAVGGACRPDRLRRLAELDAAQGQPADAILRLAALALDQSRDADRLREALRLSNEEHGRLLAASAVRHRLDPDRPPGRDAIKGLLFDFGPRATRDGMLLAQVDAPDASGWVESLIILQEEPQPKLPVGGQDIMARGITSGRSVGAILKRLQADWIRAGFPREPALVAALLDGAIAAERGQGPETSRPAAD